MTGLLNSARWVGISQASKIASQLISMVVLARILLLTDYGVMAMAGVVTALAGMLREMGTGTAIIQKKTLTDRAISTIFWLNIFMGCAIGIALWLSSSYISIFFKQPQLKGVLIALATLFPITSATTVHQALIERRSEFKTLAIMDVLTQFIGLSLAIIAALKGAGVYSFVIPSVSTAIISSVWLWSKSGWHPQWIWCWEEFKELIGFTGNLTAFNFINYFCRNADSIIIGKVMGAVLLGSYSMAYKLMLFPVQNLTWVVNRVMLPALSRMQDDKNEARKLYFKSLNLILTITAPLMVGLWVLREPFVHFVFGVKWNVVIDLLAWLAPVGLLQSALSTTGTVFTAYGRTDLLLRLGLFSTFIFVIGFWIGAQFSLIVFTAIYFVNNLINTLVIGWFVLQILEVDFNEFLEVLKPPLISAAIMGIIIFEFKLFFTFSTRDLTHLIIGTFFGIGIYMFSITILFKQSLRPLWKLVNG